MPFRALFAWPASPWREQKDISDVIADGFVKRETVCAGAYAKLCRRNGID